MLFRIIKHPQFQKMTTYYKLGLPFAIITGGFSGNILGISLSDKYIQNPLQGVSIIIGSFSLGLIGGLFYPVVIPFSAIYFMNQIRKDL